MRSQMRLRRLRLAFGLDAGVQMGPVISEESKSRIESLIATGVATARKRSSTAATQKLPGTRMAIS